MSSVDSQALGGVTMTRVSIVVPILNEAARLPTLAAELGRLQPAPARVIVVDGGSQDESVVLARELGFEVVQSVRGRAMQMNTGAAHAEKSCPAQTDWLLFLHADTRLPLDAIAQLHALSTDAQWGRFDVRLDAPQPIYRVIERLINLRSRVSKIATGDQVIFIRSALFDQIGGYREQPLMEDVELCKQLKSLRIRPVCLRSTVLTSARRWQQYGVWRTIGLMWQLRFLYWCGVSPAQLAVKYRSGQNSSGLTK